MEYFKTLTNFGFAVYVSWFLLTRIEPILNSIEKDITTQNILVKEVQALNLERRELLIQIENNLNQLLQMELNRIKK